MIQLSMFELGMNDNTVYDIIQY